MESNKDEAHKCISIAQSSLAAGDFKKALKFAEKSIRLFPTGQGEQLLKTIQVKSKARPSTTQKTTQPKAEPDRKHTPEQSKAVKSILACGQDYYKVLSVERTATDIQIKKAYRKLALQFHPDKNSAPGADEAFKLISKAFDTLSDNQKRAIHDSGGDRIRHTSGGANYRSYNRQQYYQQQQQDDFLNMFFGNNVNRRNAYDRRRRPTTSETENMTPLIPIILVAFLFLFSILFSFDSEPMYSFRPSQTHTNARFTKTNNIKYYAQPQFETTVKANQFKFKSIERQIESDWLSEVRFQCQREQRRRADLLTRAEGFLWGAGRDQKLYKQAEEMKMPNCDEARRLMTRIH